MVELRILGADGDRGKHRHGPWTTAQSPQYSRRGNTQPTFPGRTRNWESASGDAALAGGLQEEEKYIIKGGPDVHWERGVGEQEQEEQQQRHNHHHHERKPARKTRSLAEEPRVFPGGLELECNLVVPGAGVAQGGPTIIEPAEGDVLVRGTTTNVSWGLDIFEESTVASDLPSGTSSTGTLPSDLDIAAVNVTLFNGDGAVWSSFNTSNTGDFSWTVPSELEEAWTYRVAVWDATSRICGISNEFGISGELSITVTQLEGYNEEGTVDISPFQAGRSASSGGGGEVYSCGGSVGIGWSHTGLLEEVDVRVCKEANTSGTLAGLEDEDLQPFTCLEPVSDSVPANSSFLNATLTGVEDEATRDLLCGVWGEGFFARVSWAGGGSGADVFGVSDEGVAGNTVAVLGGVFLKPNDATPISIYEAQLISWEGRTGVGKDAQVDIILRFEASDSDEHFRVVVSSNARTSTDGDFLWEEPWTAFTEAERRTPEIFWDSFSLELFDAVGGGLICRSSSFTLVADPTESSSFLLGFVFGLPAVTAFLVIMQLGLMCCCFFFCCLVPHHLRKNTRRVPPTPAKHERHTTEEGRAETKANHADESSGTIPEGDRQPTPGVQAEKEETWEELQEA